jgi:phosphoenolpyruvate carboxykinase (GTP)
MRVMKWMLDRIAGTAGGVENVFGVSPQFGDLNWDGLQFTQEQFDTITSIDKAAWREELKLHEELFNLLSYHLPEELVANKEQLEKRLAD